MKDSQTARISSSKDLGVVLARARKERGLSQREVATQLGVTQKWISAIEQGKPRAWIDKGNRAILLSRCANPRLHRGRQTTSSRRSLRRRRIYTCAIRRAEHRRPFEQ